MAQRVYLIPVQPEITAAVNAAILGASHGAVATELDRCRELAIPHQHTLTMSRRYCRRLHEAAFDAAGRGEEHGLYTALRPYFLTTPSPAASAAKVEALFTASNDAARRSIFEEELEAIPEELRKARQGESEDNDDPVWEALHTDFLTLRHMREAVLAGRPYVHEIQKTKNLVEGVTAVDLGDTEAAVFAGEELIQAYGKLLGASFGRLLGLVLPTWWMGRDFWIGLLLAGRLFRLPDLPFSRRRRFRRQLTAWAESPALLFPELEVPGFFESFPLACEAYGSGLYFSPSAVVEWSGVFETTRPDLVELGVKASGYSEEQVLLLTGAIHECLLWCAERGYGFIEGDELVGSWGVR